MLVFVKVELHLKPTLNMLCALSQNYKYWFEKIQAFWSKLTLLTKILNPFWSPLAWKAIGGYCDSEFLLYVCVYVCSTLVRFSMFGSPLKSWESDYNQTLVKDATGVPSNVNSVKGQIPRSRIIWLKDAVGVLLYVNEVKGHVSRSRVIWGQVKMENVKFV